MNTNLINALYKESIAYPSMSISELLEKFNISDEEYKQFKKHNMSITSYRSLKKTNTKKKQLSKIKKSSKKINIKQIKGCGDDVTNKYCITSTHVYNSKVYKRFKLDPNQIPWENELRWYNPTFFKHENVDEVNKSHPMIMDYSKQDKDEDDTFKIDFDYRKGNPYSYYPYKHIPKLKDYSIAYPINPIGRTGAIGLGQLNKWGINNVKYMIIKAKINETDKIFLIDSNLEMKLPEIKYFIKLLDIPSVDFFLNHVFDMHLDDKTKKTKSIYSDDPRNTDNAWVEATIIQYSFNVNNFMSVNKKKYNVNTVNNIYGMKLKDYFESSDVTIDDYFWFLTLKDKFNKDKFTEKIKDKFELQNDIIKKFENSNKYLFDEYNNFFDKMVESKFYNDNDYSYNEDLFLAIEPLYFRAQDTMEIMKLTRTNFSDVLDFDYVDKLDKDIYFTHMGEEKNLKSKIKSMLKKEEIKNHFYIEIIKALKNLLSMSNWKDYDKLDTFKFYGDHLEIIRKYANY